MRENRKYLSRHGSYDASDSLPVHASYPYPHTVTSNRHVRLTELFTRASELEGPEREAFLSENCEGDAELLGEVRSLIEANSVPHALLDAPEPPLREVWSGDEPRQRGERIGQFVIERWIGSGGAGDIYLAQQERPKRQVAVKVMRHGLMRETALRRFEFESQLLGRLEHPGIARVYEANVFQDRGRSVPYFAMEYVDGALTLTDYASHHGLDTEEKLRLLIEVCEAVAHGHNQGIVHCDLKPENVLIHGSGRACVIDFGIARAIDAERTMTTGGTGTYRIAGTLPYMSPEQVSGESRAIDQRADVYALGALLFEVLTGSRPIDLSEMSLPLAVTAITTVEPQRLGKDHKLLRGDLEKICAKTLEKDRELRYESAAALADDLRRFLNNEPVLARRPTPIYQFRKFARRNRSFVAGCVLAVLSLVIGTGVAIQQAVLSSQREATSRWMAYRGNVAAAAAALGVHNTDLASSNLNDAPPAHRNWEWRHLRARLDGAIRVIEPDGDGIPSALVFFSDGERDSVLVLRDGVASRYSAEGGQHIASWPAQLVDADSSSSMIAFVEGDRVTIRGPLDSTKTWTCAELGLGDPPPDQLALSRGGGFAVLGSPEKVVRLRLSNSEVLELPIDRGGTGVRSLDVSADGVVVMASAIQGRAAIWEPETGVSRPLLDIPGFARSVAFDSSGASIAIGLQSASLGVWSVASGMPTHVREGHRHAVTAIDFDNRGRIVSGSLDRTVSLWEPNSLELLATWHGHAGGVRHVAGTSESSLIASTAEDGSLRLWDGSNLAASGEIRSGHSLVFPVAYSNDGMLLASGGSDGAVRLWDPVTFDSLAELLTDLGAITALSFGEFDRQLVATGERGVVAFDLDAGTRFSSSLPAWMSEFTISDLGFDETTRKLVLPFEHAAGELKAWDPRTGELGGVALGSLDGDDIGFVDPRGHFVVTYASSQGGASAARRADSDSGSSLIVSRVGTGEVIELPALSGAFDFRPTSDSIELAARSADDPTRVLIFDLTNQDRIGELVGHGDRIYGISYSPDGDRIATCARDGVRLWNAGPAGRDALEDDDGHRVVELHGHRSFVWSVVWSPSGEQLATGSGDGTIRVWDVRDYAAVYASRMDRGAEALASERVDELFATGRPLAELGRQLRLESSWGLEGNRRARAEFLSRLSWQ